MGGEEEMEEDDDDDVDFNPYLQCSPSAEVESGDSLNRGEESLSEDGETIDSLTCGVNATSADGELGKSFKHIGKLKDVENTVVVETEGEGFFTTEDAQMVGGSEHGYDDEDKFFELGSDDYEEEEFEEVEQDEDVANDDGEVGRLESSQFPSRSACNGEEVAVFDGCLNLFDNDVSTWKHHETCYQNLACAEKPVDVTDRIRSPPRIVDGSLGTDKDITGSLPRSEKLSIGRRTSDTNEAMDAIFKRTRANYSLADMSLDQLETFLQESDEDENFQCIDDEEEYRKFLLALQETEGPITQVEQGVRKEDDDDEEDKDFEIEIEEALESDDTTESVRRRIRRRPETREKRRQRAQLLAKQSIVNQSNAPLRQLLPHPGSFVDDCANLEKRKSVDETGNVIWQLNGNRKPSVNGFTAHQIGQLYCLIHEHVQLLVQVFSLCALDPARQQVALDTRRMLMELAEKRDLLLSWKKSAFPDFCFRPPYTHPSLTEDNGDDLTSVRICNSDDSFSPSASYDQNARELANGCAGYLEICGSNTKLSAISASGSFSLGQNPQIPTQVRSGQENAPCGRTLDISKLIPASKALEQAKVNPASTFHHWREPVLPTDPSGANAMSLPPATSYSTAASLLPDTSQAILQTESVKSKWTPLTSGPVRSLLDVGPLALVKSFLMDMSHVVQEYRQSYVESGVNNQKCVREPLFVVSAINEYKEIDRRNQGDGTPSQFLGAREILSACISKPQVKKTMAAALVESTKKQSLALVPKDTAVAVQRFLPFFNKAFFPHKAPPATTASRLLFTDAEDELLAMGLMMYNTDWEAIRQRFLPSKSTHQIFVRQKNRSSARAPENSIKAVRRMKSSPLTSLEKTSIQEGLGAFKSDWTKVWQVCVPHRDPALLPRQWRIAVGTQKSYKTSETSKERRRVYEANRRQRIANKNASDKCGIVDEEYVGVSATVIDEDDRVNNSGHMKDVDDVDKVYIREAFLDDWRPRSTPLVGSSGPRLERKQNAFTSLSRKRKSAIELPSQLSNISTWVGQQTVNNICQRKQTVKLAPGLPSLKLPPRVHILSQSHVQPQASFSVGTRWPPVTSQWTQIAGLGSENLLPQSIHITCAPMHEPGLQGGSSTLQQFGCTSSHFKQGQTTAIRASNDSPDLPTGERTEPLDTISAPCTQSPSAENTETCGLVGRDSCQSVTQSIQPCFVQFNPLFCEDSSDNGHLSTKSPMAGKEDGVMVLSDHFTSDNQDQMPMSSIVEAGPTTCVQLFSQLSSSLTIPPAVASSKLVSLQVSAQASLSLSKEYRVISNDLSEIEVVGDESDVRRDWSQAKVGKENCHDQREHGSLKPSRSLARTNKRSQQNYRTTRHSSQKLSRSPTIKGSPPSHQPCLDVEGFSPHKSASRNTRSNHSRRGDKIVEGFASTSVEETSLQQIIVMEQEELSDSEDDVDSGLQFEYEEMGDSDKDGEVTRTEASAQLI